MIFVGEKIAIKTWKVNSVICCGPSKPISHMVNPGKQVVLMQRNKEGFKELSADCFAKAIVFLVGIYYIFHLEYPGPAKGAFMFLQEHILHDFLSKRPLRYAMRLAEMKL